MNAVTTENTIATGHKPAKTRRMVTAPGAKMYMSPSRAILNRFIHRNRRLGFHSQRFSKKGDAILPRPPTSNPDWSFRPALVAQTFSFLVLRHYGIHLIFKG